MLSGLIFYYQLSFYAWYFVLTPNYDAPRHQFFRYSLAKYIHLDDVGDQYFGGLRGYIVIYTAVLAVINGGGGGLPIDKVSTS